MAQPTPYVPATNFQQEETSAVAGRSTVRTSRVDAELQAVSLTLSQILTNLAIIQRDDTQLNDLVVTTASLSANVKALFAGGINPRGAWVTATAYAVKDIVETLSPLISYVCVIAHTSGTFATDRGAGKWMVLGSEPGLGTFTSVALSTGGITLSTNNTQDLAATANRFRSGYFGTSVFASTSVVTPLVGTTTATPVGFQYGGSQVWNYSNTLLTPIVDNTMGLGGPANRWANVMTPIIDSGTTGSLSLKTNSGQTGFQVENIGGTSVNNLAAIPNITGQSVTLVARGTDSNITITYASKAGGSHNFSNDAGEMQFQVLRTASSTRNITVTGSNGGNPTIGVTGGSLAITPDVVLAGTISIGTTPAAAGTVRLPTSGSIACRNNANSGDVAIVSLSTINGVTDIVLLNQSGAGIVGRARQKAGVPTTSDLPTDGMWSVWRDTTGNTTKVYYNNAGAIIASAAFA